MIVSRATAEKFLGKKLKGLGGGKRSYYVLSAEGTKNLGGPYTKPAAKKRLGQVEYFKRNPESREPVVGAQAGRRIFKEMRRKKTFSIPQASKATGLSEVEIRSGLNWLQEHGRISQPAGGKYRIFAVNPEGNPRAFWGRDHDWEEVLIARGGKRITRKQILDYYKRNQRKIWPFLENQTVMIIMAPKRNEFVRRRHDPRPGKKFIKLTKLKGIDDPKSFEYWIYRRTIEFHPTLTSKSTPILWVDLDMHSTRTVSARKKLLGKMKRAVPKLKKAMKKMGVARVYVYDSGSDGGIHLEGNLKKPMAVDSLRKKFTKLLAETFADDSVFTTGIAKSGQIRLDTTTLHRLGSLRAPYSMTVMGTAKLPVRSRS